MEKHITEETIIELLKEVYDPELGINIVDLGLIYEVKIHDGQVYVRMTLTTPGCPMHTAIVGGVHRALEGEPGIQSVDVDLVWEPRWTPDRMTPEGREALGYF